MQDRYVGDVGDFAKFSLLNYLGVGRRLGVAWYLYPDEGHNADGKHIGYLQNRVKWRACDPVVFDGLKDLVESCRRNVHAVASSKILNAEIFADELLICEHQGHHERKAWRSQWFNRTLSKLSGCDMVFLDPDNGMRATSSFKHGSRKHWKSVP